MREFGDEMCRRIVAAGIPVWRAFCSVYTLHPQIAGTAYIWRRGEKGATRLTAPHGFFMSDEFAASPIAEVRRSGETIRRRLCDPSCPLDFPALAEFRAEGATDYVAMPMRCSSGEINSITWTTDREGGFQDDELEGLSAVAEALAIITELQSTRRIAQHLANTYIGHRTGNRVLSGAITRGSEEIIRAVIWFCDLRGFTAMTDRMPRRKTIEMLNQYFEIMVEALSAEGGEVLKFIGDAILAIFELQPSEDPSVKCAAAMRAATNAMRKIDECNRERADAAEPAIELGLALHLGEVSYGNIGAPDRLDFTVIGPAVNHASRLQKLASDLGERTLMSASFAAALGGPVRSLGPHHVRGIADPLEVFISSE